MALWCTLAVKCMTDATQGLQHNGPANKFWPGCHSMRLEHLFQLPLRYASMSQDVFWIQTGLPVWGGWPTCRKWPTCIQWRKGCGVVWLLPAWQGCCCCWPLMAAAAAAYAFWPPHLAPNTLLASPASAWVVALLAAWEVALLAAWACFWRLFVALLSVWEVPWVVSWAAAHGMMQWPPWVVWQAAAWLLTSLVLAMPVLVEELLCACS